MRQQRRETLLQSLLLITRNSAEGKTRLLPRPPPHKPRTPFRPQRLLETHPICLLCLI